MAGKGGHGSTVAWIVGLVIVTLVAGVLRLYVPGPTIQTVDEFRWMQRSAAWETAFEQRDWESMVAAESGRPATRPGVTTMWTGYLSKSLVEMGAPGFSGVMHLRAAHQLMAIWCTALLVPFMVIGSRLITRRGALVAGGVLAVEPLLVGHSALLHTDALVTMGGAVATVALLATFDEARRHLGRAEPRGPWWSRPELRLGAAAGAGGAVAVLTKVSALVPLGGAAAVALALHCWLVWRAHGSLRVLGRSLVPTVAAPAGVALLVMVALWPALWVAPGMALSDALASRGLADEATPRLFLGEVIRRGDWRYYGAEVLFRSSAWLLLAMPSAVGWMVWRRQAGRPPVMSRRNAAVLVGSGLLYTAGIVTSSKQYGRYLLPLLALVALALGAVGEDLVRVLRHRYRRQRRPMPRSVTPALGLGVLTVCAAFTLSLAPYQISHVNPLAGGQPVAERNIPLGWGEGKERILAAYARRGDCETWAATGAWMNRCFGANRGFDFLDGGVEPPRYVLRYVFDMQLGREPEGLARYLERNATRIEAVVIDGVAYAELWEMSLDE